MITEYLPELLAGAGLTLQLVALATVLGLVLAMVVAIALQVNASKWVEVIYYFVAGLAWTIPAGAIIWWMQSPGPDPGDKGPQA